MIEYSQEDDDQQLSELTQKRLMDAFGFEQEMDLKAERYQIELDQYLEEEKNTYKRR